MKWLTLLAVLFLVGCGAGSKSSVSIQPTPSPSVSSVAVAKATVSKPNPSTQLRILENYDKLPLAFEENRGQVDPRVKFVSHGAGYTLFLTADEAVLSVPDGKVNNKRPRTNRVNQVHQSPVIDRHLSSSRSEQQTSDLNLSMKLAGSDPHARVIGVDELSSKSNFLIGNDPKKWQMNLPNYAKVKYADVYPGVDLMYYGNHRQLEYDFVVAPGADPNIIRFNVAADHTSATTHRAAPVRITAAGDLMVKMNGGEILLHKPVAYQTNGSGAKDYVRARYIPGREQSQISVAVASYDKGRPLVIDPVLSYSTYLAASDGLNAVAVDASGNVYVTGSTHSSNFPTTPGAFQTTCPTGAGGCPLGNNAVVSKINATGSALIYSTYLSGSFGALGTSIAVDSTGNAYVTGFTESADFPVTTGAFQTVCHACTGNIMTSGNNAFVTKLNPSGSALVYSTFLGGSAYEQAEGIALDASGNAYVTGSTSSSDFPVTPGSFQPTYDSSGTNGDAFVTKLNAQGSALVYSTYLGGSSGGGQIVVNSAGNAYVTGGTASPTFPTTPGAFATTCKNCGPGQDTAGHPLEVGFVTEFNANGSALLYSTFLGGSDADFPSGMALDASGNIYVTGYTYSNDFPVTAGAFQTTCKGGNCGGQLSDAFLSKLNSTGSALVYSTYIGGSGYDGGGSIAVDGAGNAYVVGQTISNDFPVTPGAFQSHCNTCTLTNYSGDAFVFEMNPSGSALLYSTYLGGSGEDAGTGISIDTSGNIYAVGVAYSTDFPTTVGALQPTASSATVGGFVAKFAFGSTQTGPAATVTPTNLNFGSLVIGTESGSKTITLSNNGGAALAISSIDVTGTNSSDFNQTNNCGTSVAAGTSCTIDVTFTPAASGMRSASVTITDNAANSPQSVSLTGTGAAGTTLATLSPTSLTFSSQVVGSSSTTQAITLTNGGNAPLSVTSIAVTGANSADFTQTDTCGSSVAASGSCTISVTFKPSATGTRSASVTVTDNAANSPQTEPLTGSGTDFSFGVANGGSYTATVSGGNKATYNLQVTPMNGFSGAVALSCSGAPSEATCTVSPSSMTLNGAAGAFTVSVSTTSSSIVIPQFRPDRRHGPKAAPLCLLLALVAFFLLTGFRNSTSGLRKRLAYIPALAVLVVTLAWVGGCSGLNTVHTHNAGTPAGTYTLTITGTSNGVTRTQSLTLTVQ